MGNVPHPIKHGTIGGYRTELRRYGSSCEACKKAWRIYNRRRNNTLPRWINKQQFEENQRERRPGSRKRRNDIKRSGRWLVPAPEETNGT